MKIIVTTSNKYLHILPIFCFLFNKYWSKDQQVEIVGYDTPTFPLPSNFYFHSMGEQIGGAKNFGTDLRKYFSAQDDYFIWMMEDTFIREPIKKHELEYCKSLTEFELIGRIGLSSDNAKFYDTETGTQRVLSLPQLSEYRLSTQVAIWNKKFLLKYLQENMDPWEFECQTKIEDEFECISLRKQDAPVVHNEGVRKRDLYKYDLNGIPEEVIQEMYEQNIFDSK